MNVLFLGNNTMYKHKTKHSILIVMYVYTSKNKREKNDKTKRKRELVGWSLYVAYIVLEGVMLFHPT
jgi:hypothetical protein